jgi:hypothetical protein
MYLACTNTLKPKKKILHASTLGSRGSSLQLYDDGTYTMMCFLFDSTNGRYRMENDTIYLQRPFKGERCDLKFGTLVIKHEKDSSYWDEKQAKNVIVKIQTSLDEGNIYELDGANKIVESPYTYQIIK